LWQDGEAHAGRRLDRSINGPDRSRAPDERQQRSKHARAALSRPTNPNPKRCLITPPLQASVHDLALPPALQQQLAARGVRTARDCLHHTPTDLAELLDVPHSTAQRLLLDVSAQSAPGYITVSRVGIFGLVYCTGRAPWKLTAHAARPHLNITHTRAPNCTASHS
jgi:hypothetical protein